MKTRPLSITALIGFLVGIGIAQVRPSSADPLPVRPPPACERADCSCNGNKVTYQTCKCGTAGTPKSQTCYTKYILGTSTPCGTVCESCYNVCDNKPSSGCK
jgi:hypothetical protein